MKSTIREWNPDAGTYGDVLLTLYAPDTGDAEADEQALWYATTTVAPLMAPCAIFWDDEATSSNHYSAYRRRYAA